MLVHGASAFTKDRLFTVSDPFKVSVCKTCGIMTSTTTGCQMCKGDQVASVNFPYAAKLCAQEFSAMAIKMNITPNEN